MWAICSLFANAGREHSIVLHKPVANAMAFPFFGVACSGESSGADQAAAPENRERAGRELLRRLSADRQNPDPQVHAPQVQNLKAHGPTVEAVERYLVSHDSPRLRPTVRREAIQIGQPPRPAAGKCRPQPEEETAEKRKNNSARRRRLRAVFARCPVWPRYPGVSRSASSRRSCSGWNSGPADADGDAANGPCRAAADHSGQRRLASADAAGPAAKSSSSAAARPAPNRSSPSSRPRPPSPPSQVPARWSAPRRRPPREKRFRCPGRDHYSAATIPRNWDRWNCWDPDW